MGLRLRLFTFSISITITIRIRMYIMYICSDWTGLVSGCIGVYAVLRHMEELFPFIFVLLIMFFSLFSPNMDWIAESDRLISIENNCLREPIPALSLAFFYINKSSEVVSIIHDSIEFAPSDPRIISKEKLLQLIQLHKKSDANTQYTLKDICLFHIDAEPEQIGSFHEQSFSQYWTPYPIVDSIVLPPSIFIFHSLHTLYFFYYEEDKHFFKSVKSSLKSPTTSHRTTKRVRWSSDSDSSVVIHNKNTRKKYT